MEKKEDEILVKIKSLGKKKTNLLKWLLRNNLTPNAVHYKNFQVDEFSDKENALQKQVWEIEERINAIKLQNYNTEGIGDFLKTL